MKTKRRPAPTSAPCLLRSHDYSMFELHEWNRNLHDTELLEKSMSKHGFMPSSAIQCVATPDGKLKIIRGHNRFAVAQRLNLPIWYIVDDSNIDLFDLEGDNSATWNAVDFLNARARAGEPEFLRLESFIRKHKIPVGAAASLLGCETPGSGNQNQNVRKGTFKSGDEAHANDVVEITDACRAMGLTFATSTGFISAISAALRVPELDADRLLRRIRSNAVTIKRRNRREDYLEELEAVYNFRSTGPRLPLRLRALEIQAQRRKAVPTPN